MLLILNIIHTESQINECSDGRRKREIVTNFEIFQSSGFFYLFFLISIPAGSADERLIIRQEDEPLAKDLLKFSSSFHLLFVKGKLILSLSQDWTFCAFQPLSLSLDKMKFIVWKFLALKLLIARARAITNTA